MLFLGVTSGSAGRLFSFRLPVIYDWDCGLVGLLTCCAASSACRFFSAIALTAFSTLRSNSSSDTVRVVRSRDSMKEMAPDNDER